VDAVLQHFRENQAPAVLVLPTGAGKSLVIAEIARRAKGKVLVLAHVKELCRQNYEKFRSMSREEAGIFSAGLGKKQAEHQVTFGGVQSVARGLAFWEQPLSLMIIDECHRVSGEEGTEYLRLIAYFREKNPQLCILGLTATPYRLNEGWIYRRHYEGHWRTNEERLFEKCVYEVTLAQLIHRGYLTRPTLEDAPIAQYDFSTHESEGEQAFIVRHPRVTQSIVESLVQRVEAQNRQGVMVFAATVEHAHEILQYLPRGEAALITGQTSREERDTQLRAFVDRQIRYVVNVAVLTTGFDAPHVDCIAILRRTGSLSLYQQIVGRGLRLFPGKSDCLVIDYAGNGYNIYSPEVGSGRPDREAEVVDVVCPECGFTNQFWGKKDESGAVLEHYGRRCHGEVALAEDGRSSSGRRCSYRFRFKECPSCSSENDIAARSCSTCGHRLVDPDEMLKDALRLKDSLVLRVAGMQLAVQGTTLKITYHDEDGATLSEKFEFQHDGARRAFNLAFGRRIASGRRPLELQSPEQAKALEAHLPVPDFVVGQRWKKARQALVYLVKERVFDYQGRYRRAEDAPN
ncbi:MAG: DEAD/DEAH box helicase, partial [Polyangiaceae bacterium]|nr:DEAD/DEAH box helicase [Polyangiaceae bacterium]